jgi:serine/threonine protein kinase
MADKYEKVAKVGEGSFGVVWKVRHRETGQVFARKKIRMQARDNGVSLAAIDEINALQVRLWCCVWAPRAPGRSARGARACAC